MATGIRGFGLLDNLLDTGLRSLLHLSLNIFACQSEAGTHRGIGVLRIYRTVDVRSKDHSLEAVEVDDVAVGQGATAMLVAQGKLPLKFAGFNSSRHNLYRKIDK